MIDSTLLHLAAVIATVAAAWAAAKSAKAAQSSASSANQTADTAEQALKVGQRAWVVVTEIKITTRSPSPLPSFINTRIQNTGQTPAMNVRMFQKCLIAADFPDKPGYEAPDIPTSSASLGSGAYASIPTELIYQDDEAFRISDGQKRLYVYGRATYNDVFGSDGETRWCSFYNPVTQQFSWFTKHNSIA